MAQIETWLNQDMMQSVKVRYLDGNLFSQDNAGNLIGVKLTRDGEDYSGGGTVSANVIRSDGGTVAVTGALSGNVATVVLPQSAYAVPGVVSIVVKLTVSGAIITIAAVVANIYQSSTETAIDPGTIIPSIQTLINQINTAVASIPADYSSLWATLAPAFSTSTAYTIGQYVTYDGGLYRFTSAHPAGAWSASDATAAVVGGVLTDLQTGKADKTDPVFYGTISKGRKGNSQAGTGSVALGDNVTANGWFSQAEGQGTIANGSYQRASGKYNVADTGNTYAEMVGNGYAEVDPQTFVVTEHRSNARTLDWNGNETLAGDLTVNKGTANEVTLGSEVSNLKNDIDDLDTAVFDITEASINKYNSTLVTSETVYTDKRLYGNGTLKDATGIDVSPFMPIKPSTDYWMGLVPPYENTGVPWYGQSVAIEFYSAPSESSQISRIDRVDNNAITFTTPSNANYYRFNIARSAISLSVVNSRCMLVEGSTAPSEYEPYSEYSKESKLTSIIDTMDDVVSGNIFNNYTPVVGKYYDGTEHTAESYNYYVVPVLKGVKYKVLPKMRMHVIKHGDTTIVTDLTDKKNSFTPTVNGIAYITVYAADTPMLFIANTDKTLTIDGKAADAKVTGDILFNVEDYCKNYNLTLFANSHVLGKYYSLSGSVGTNSSYNYYEKIPVVSGNTYLFTGRGARYCVLYNNNTIVQTAENVSVFTANYDGDLYVTEYASDPISIYLYNDFFKLDTWTNKNINEKLGTENSNTIAYATNEGDICHFKLNGYSGQYFTNCLLYAVQSGGNVIVASLYSDTGEYVFIAPSATTYIVYINKSQSETATINFELTNLSKNTIFNSITRHDIINRFMPHIYGKKIACLGDSFTYGVATYVSKLNDRYLSHAINYGVASSRIVLDTTSGGTTISSFLNRYSAMDNDADIITVFGGINDSYDIGAGNLALGTIDSPLDTNTFYGGLKLLVTNLMKKYTDKQIIGIIPPDCQIGQYYIDNLPDVQQAEREVYGMYGIPIIDIRKECYKMSTLPEMVALYRAASDNIHPSGAGQEALCDTISAGIRRIIP